MRGVYLTYIPSSDGQRKLVPRLEDHVILPEIAEYDVMVQIKACGLSRIDTKILSELNPTSDQIPVGFEITGIVTKVGAAVRSFVVSEEVTVCCATPGTMARLVLCHENVFFSLVSKPVGVSHVDCAACLRGGVRAYTALHFQTHLEPGAIALVFSAASGDGLMVIQLCEALGVKVIAAVSNGDEVAILKKLHPSLLRIIDLSSTQNLIDVCLQETGGLGVNCAIDSGVAPNYSLSNFLIESVALRRQLEQETCRYQYEVSPSSPTSSPTSSSPSLLPTKHQIISCLAARGQWVTSQPDLQLDPPESQQLFMKGGSLHFLFEPLWTLSSAHQGSFLDILSNVVAKLETGVLKPYIYKTVTLGQVCEELLRLGNYGIGKVVMTTEVSK